MSDNLELRIAALASVACELMDKPSADVAAMSRTNVVAGREFHAEFGRFANALFNGRFEDATSAMRDAVAMAARLNIVAADWHDKRLTADRKAADADSRYRAQSLELNALQVRNDTQAETIRKLTAELAEARAHAATCEGQANRSDAEWIVADDRAKAAEGRLAAIRPIAESMLYDMGELPFSVARSHPAGHSLLRTFLDSGDTLRAALAGEAA